MIKPYTTESSRGQSGELYEQRLYYTISKEDMNSIVHIKYTLAILNHDAKDSFMNGDNSVILNINGKDLPTKFINIDLENNDEVTLYETEIMVNSVKSKVLNVIAEYNLGKMTEHLTGGTLMAYIVVPRIKINEPNVKLLGNKLESTLMLQVISNVDFEYIQYKINDKDWYTVKNQTNFFRMLLEEPETIIQARIKTSSGEFIYTNKLTYIKD